VLAALGAAVWSGLVVGLVECAIDDMVICVLDDGLSLILALRLEVDVSKCRCVSGCVKLIDGEKGKPERRDVESIDFILLININEPSMVAYCNFVVISKLNDLLADQVS